jgi:protein required for attachment to host cells
MKKQWILVANASMARLLRRGAAIEPLIPLETLTHEQSRQKAGDLADDRPGTDNSRDANRFEARTDMHRKEHLRFANEISARLDKGLADGEFESLRIFASNPFLGELRARLSEAVDKRVEQAIDRDFTSLALAELESHIASASAAGT